MKLESKTQDEYVYLLSGDHLTTYTIQTRKVYVNTIDQKKITCTKEIDRKDTKSMNKFTWETVLH